MQKMCVCTLSLSLIQGWPLPETGMNPIRLLLVTWFTSQFFVAIPINFDPPFMYKMSDGTRHYTEFM